MFTLYFLKLSYGSKPKRFEQKMDKQDAKRKNNEETVQLPDVKKVKIEPEKPKRNLGNFVVESFDCFKYGIFQQVIGEVIEKAEQEEKVEQKELY